MNKLWRWQFSKLWREDRWYGHVLISAFFLLLIASLVVSLSRYWINTLQPRLYSNAETQAQILAQSQAAILTKTLEYGKTETLQANLYQAVQEILITTDPSIGGRMVTGLSLAIDYDLIAAKVGSLDFAEDNHQCTRCFKVSAPLINQSSELIGIADFTISKAYYSVLSDEIKSKLFAESSLVLALLIIVWFTMSAMFDRVHRAKQIIEASDQAKTRFMANVTHELRTPLNAILGYTQMYKSDPNILPAHKHGIDTIDRSAEHLLLLINDILDFSSSSQQTLRLSPQECHVPTLLKTLVNMMEISTKLKEIEFIHRFADDLPTYVMTDEKRLRQVLINLLSNAVKFTHQGKVLFEVSLLTHTAQQCRIRFSVADSGLGIAKTDLKKIFIPFHQLDNAITRAEGSGLGLTISQQIVHLMDSKLNVESKLHEGSRFWFDLDLPAIKHSTTEPINADAPTDSPEAPPLSSIQWPPQALLQDLLLHCQQHNVLAVRASCKKIEDLGEYQTFLDEVQPYVRHYRFKQLANWLEASDSDAS